MRGWECGGKIRQYGMIQEPANAHVQRAHSLHSSTSELPPDHRSEYAVDYRLFLSGRGLSPILSIANLEWVRHDAKIAALFGCFRSFSTVSRFVNVQSTSPCRIALAYQLRGGNNNFRKHTGCGPQHPQQLSTRGVPRWNGGWTMKRGTGYIYLTSETVCLLSTLLRIHLSQDGLQNIQCRRQSQQEPSSTREREEARSLGEARRIFVHQPMAKLEMDQDERNLQGESLRFSSNELPTNPVVLLHRPP